MLQHNLYSALHENISTTDMNTQIDVAFTYSSHYHCGTYESYFLEHKPIYICLSDGENVWAKKEKKWVWKEIWSEIFSMDFDIQKERNKLKNIWIQSSKLFFFINKRYQGFYKSLKCLYNCHDLTNKLITSRNDSKIHAMEYSIIQNK